MSEGPGPGTIIGAIFLILMGLCLLFVGGGCTVMLASESTRGFYTAAIPLFLISLGTAAAGVALLMRAIKLLRG